MKKVFTELPNIVDYDDVDQLLPAVRRQVGRSFGAYSESDSPSSEVAVELGIRRIN